MSDKHYYGKNFEFDKGFFSDPKEIGYIELFQLGEVCFEDGYEIDPHVQVCHEITYVISGTGVVCVNGEEIKVSEGSIVFNKMGDRHSIRSSYNSKLRYFYIGFTFSKYTKDEVGLMLSEFYNRKLKRKYAKDKYDIMPLFIRLINEFYAKIDLSERLIQNYLEQILILIYRNFIEAIPAKLVPDQSVNSVGYTTFAMIKYIEDNIYTIDRLTDISDYLGYNYNYLSHLFKRKTGMAIQSYVNYKKIEKSLELIDSGRHSITEIASMLNYKTVQSFCKSFRRTLDMSPTEYKKSKREI